MRGSAGDAPEAPEGPAAAPAASDASPTGVNLHTGQPWVDWKALRSGRYVTVDGGCTEVVNNDGTPARSRTTDAGARLVYGRIELGSDAKRKNITRDKKIKVVGSCVRQGETCAWVAWRFVVAVTDSVVAYNAASGIADSADSSRRSRRERRTDQRKSAVAESQRADRQPKKRARSRASGGSSSPALAVDGQNSSPQPGEDAAAGLSSLVAAATSTSVKLALSTTTDVSSTVVEKAPGSHWVNKAAVRRAEASVAAATEQVSALERENAELKAQLAVAKRQAGSDERKIDRLTDDLFSAISQLDVAEVKRCIEDGADVTRYSWDLEMTALGFAASTFIYPSKLHDSEQRKDGSVVKLSEVPRCTVEMLELLACAGAEADEWRYDYTPLMNAADAGSSCAVEWLLNHGANYAAINRNGETALQMAKFRLAVWDKYKTQYKVDSMESWYGVENAYAYYRNEYLRVIKLLMSRAAAWSTVMAAEMEAAVEQAVLDRLLLFAINCFRLSCRDKADCLAWMKQLIRAGANVNAVVPSYYAGTAMHEAAHGNCINVVKVLVDAGAKINLPNLYGETPLLIAACKGSSDMVRWLLQRGARWQLAFAHSAIWTDWNSWRNWDSYNREGHDRLLAATIVEKLCEMVVELNES